MNRFICCGFILVFAAIACADEASEKAGVNYFEKHIRPVLVKHCYECHSADSDEVGGNLLLDTRAGVRKGGDMGPAVSTKTPNKSLLLKALQYDGLEMPPEEQLPDDVIAKFRRWIAVGAPDPRDGKAPSKVASKSNLAADLWSLKPVDAGDTPNVRNENWPRDDIDRYILHELEAHDLTPAKDADPNTLLRRISFDLVGLPPQVDDVKAFVESPTQEFLAAYVDRLLDSPQFGERWGRHWLDVVRYGESAGSSRDALTPYAWRYRDYVIDSFNADKPYDRFVTEQLAGDLLPAENAEQKNKQTVATGLLAIGSKSLNGGNLQLNIADDQIDVVGKAMLGLTISCARCHDHKFDPIPTKDYYALAGIFTSTETRYGGGLKKSKNPAERAKTHIVLAGGENVDEKTIADFSKKQATVKRKRDSAAKRLKALENKLKGKELSENEIAQRDRVRTSVNELNQELEDLNKNAPPEPELAMGVVEGKVADTKIRIRGEANQQGETAPRGFLSCVTAFESPIPTAKASGRLELAQWITHPKHPLTSRVMANRIWQHLMGRGLVESVDNFGFSGSEPTHPQLLDYLAAQFIAEGWSTKSLIRKIVLSRTYQMSSTYNETNYTIDAPNTWYWRMNRRRLEAEPIRDAMLAVSGNINLNRPHGSTVLRIGEGEVGRGINTALLAEPFPHRSVYLPIIRGIIPEMLKVFDFPEASNPQGRRDVSNVPAQSLFLMNSAFVGEQAEGLAKRIINANTENEQRIQHAFLICFSREASPNEVAASLAFINRSKEKDDINHWAAWTQALLASAEFRYIN